MKQAKRYCGTCTACCTTHGIPSLNKAPGDACSKIAGRCSIYEARPAECRDFDCLWLQGMFDGADRPDRLGVVASVTGEDREQYEHGHALALYEAYPGGFEKAFGFITKMAQKILVIVVRLDRTREVLGPPAEVARAKATAARFLAMARQ